MTDQGQRQRRRGEELEAALLAAAWDELVEAGFGELTMESVAARAKTGVAVLYRRWPSKHDLVLAAIADYRGRHPVEFPDTGSLRGDLLAMLNGINDERSSLTAVIAASFSGLAGTSDLSPADIRARLISVRPVQDSEIYQRAAARGEIDLAAIPPEVLSMPFDLMRHDLLMTYQPVPRERLTAIVDHLFLPLVALYRDRASGPAGAPARSAS